MEKLKRISLNGCNNLRDLGGYRSTLGSSKWNVCYRCDLPLCTQDEWNVLYDQYKVRAVIDLRSTSERTTQTYPQQDERIDYYHIPLIKEEGLDLSAMDIFHTSMAESYLGIVLTGTDNLVHILTKIAHYTKTGAVLYHCTAGKDRTGIISYMLYHLCGVEDVDIMADYQVSSTYNFYGSNAGNELLESMSKSENSWMHSQPEALGSLISYFKEHDMIQFLLEHGMKIEDIQSLQQQLQIK